MTLNSRVYILFALAWALFVGLLDYKTTAHLQVAPFYFPSIFLFAWFGRRPAGLWFTLGATCLWLSAHVLQLQSGIHWVIPLLNYAGIAAAFFAFFLVVTAWKKQLTNAGKDPLTGVANRRTLHNYARREIERCRRTAEPISIGYLDCDDFKLVNEQWGHHAGDQLLVLIARTLEESIRPTDLVARVGGDEFAIILSGTGCSEAHAIFKKFQDLTRNVAQELGTQTTVSVGAVTFQKPLASVEEMLEQADHLMYEVKKSGKNQLRHQTK